MSDDEPEIPIGWSSGWFLEEAALDKGEMPDFVSVVRKLRDPMHPAPPQSIRNWLADVVDGKVRRPRGRPGEPASLKARRGHLVRRALSQIMEDLEANYVGDRYEVALEELSETLDVATGTLRGWAQYGTPPKRTSKK